MEGGALIKSIVHSKPPHALLNMQNKKRKMFLETTAIVDVEEDKTEIWKLSKKKMLIFLQKLHKNHYKNRFICVIQFSYLLKNMINFLKIYK